MNSQEKRLFIYQRMVEDEKRTNSQYYLEHPQSVLPSFLQELNSLGFRCEVTQQVRLFLPQYKDIILPLVMKYYPLTIYENEKDYFVNLCHYKGCDKAVPFLLEAFYDPKTTRLVRESIGDSLCAIRSKKYISDYLKIVSSPQYGIARAFLCDLLGSLKSEEAIPIFIDYLETDLPLSPFILRALSAYKREDFRPIFERYAKNPDKETRKIALTALNKLDRAAEKKSSAK